MPNSLKSLLPCPHCGGKAALNGDDTCGYFVSCETRTCCMFNRAIWAHDEIVDAWNTRAPIAEGGGDPPACSARDARSNAMYRGPAHPDAARERLADRRLIAEPVAPHAANNAPSPSAQLTATAAIESLSRQGGETERASYYESVLRLISQVGMSEHGQTIFEGIHHSSCVMLADGALANPPKATRASEAGDWVMVPREATHEMELALCDALQSGDYSGAECLNRANAAAPAPGGGRG